MQCPYGCYGNGTVLLKDPLELIFFKTQTALFLLVFDLMIYRTQISNQQIKNRAYSPDTVRYQVTDLIWLRYHGHLVEFGKVNTKSYLLCYASAA